MPDRPTGVTGFKSTLAASGDFTITLDLKINKRPVLGWITWWQLLIVGNIVVIGGLLGYRAWSNRRSD